MLYRSLTEVDCPAQDTFLSLATDRQSTLTQISQSSSIKKQQDQPPLSMPSQASDRTIKKEQFSDGTISATEITPKKSVSRIRRGMMAGPRSSSSEVKYKAALPVYLSQVLSGLITV